jgi:beta-galactosidase
MFKNKKNTRYYILLFCLFFTFNFVAYSQVKFYKGSRNFDLKKDFNNLFLSDYRDIIDLKGNWEYSLDDETWNNISIPSSYSYNKKIIFQKKFFTPEKYISRKNFLLVCYGINYQCEIYINNEFVGHHIGGYTSFVIRVPDRIINRENDNTIKIVVYNNLDSKGTVPLQQQVGGWKNYGGIFREIYLLSISPIYFDDIDVSHNLTPNYNSANIKVSYEITSTELKKLSLDNFNIVSNQKNSFELSFQVLDRSTNTVVAQSYSLPFEIESDKNIKLSLETVINSPLLWSPDSPNFYLIRSEIKKNGKIIDQIDVSYGIKDVKIIKNDFYLNGKLFELKGINYVEDYPDCGNALTYEQIEKDIVSIKNLGVNIVNARYHPVNPYFVHICDKYGIFICQTIPVWNTPSDFLGVAEYNHIIENYTKEMVIRDKNNPSIFAWGIGLTFNSSDRVAYQYCTEMQNLIKSIDNKHFVYYQSAFITNDTCSLITDFCMANIDASDIKRFSSLLTIWKKKNLNKTIVINILGTLIVPENHNGFSDPQSTEYQAHFIFDRFRNLKQQYVNNMFLTTLADFKSEVPILMFNNNADRFLLTVGVQNHNRENRISYNMLRALYNDEKTPNLVLGNYNQSHPIIFIVFGLILLIIFAYFFNAYRRLRENIVRSFLRPFNFYADIRDQRIMSSIQTVIMGFIIVGTISLVTANLLYFYRFNFLLDYILSYILLSNEVKLWLIYKIWDPFIFILSFILINLILIVLLTIFLKICVVISKKKIYLINLFTVIIWSALPTICLIPIGMILSRIVENDAYLLPMLALLLVFILWFFYRLIRGISIVVDVRLSKIYFYSLLLIIIFVGSYLFYLDYSYSIVSYFRFLVDLTKGLQI